MKVVVAAAPLRDFYFTPHRFSALGSRIIRRILSRRGISCTLLDFPVMRSRRLPLPRTLSHLEPYLLPSERGRLSFFRSYHHYGPSLPECARRIRSENPDLLLISCFAFCYADEAIALAGEVRKKGAAVRIAVGGSGPSAHPGYFLRSGSIDHVLVGEAETCLDSYIDALRGDLRWEKVPNLYRRAGSRIVAPATVNRTGPGEAEFAWSRTTETRDDVSLALHFSRGCHRNCRYCSIRLIHGSGFRTASPEKVEDGMSEIVANYGECGKTLRINFEDDNLLLDPEFFFRILEELRSRLGRVVFSMENGLDYTLLAPPVIDRMAALGVTQLNLSLVSTDPRILRGQDRFGRLSHYDSVIGEAQRHGIRVITYLICGFRDDSPAGIADTLLALFERPTRIGFSPYYPVPGLPDWEDLSAFDGIPAALSAGSSLFPWNSSLSTGQLVTLFRLCRLLNVLKKPIDVRSAASLPRGDGIAAMCLREKRLYTAGADGSAIPVPGIDQSLVETVLRRVSDIAGM